MVVNICGIIFLGLEKLVADLVWKWVAWTLVHWISQLSKLLAQHENITLDWTTWQELFMPYLFSYLWSEVYLFIVQVLALHLYDDPFSLAWLLALINKVVCVACESRSWFVLHTPEHIKQTNNTTDQWHKWLPKQLQPCKREASAHRAFVPGFTLIFTKWNF